MQVYHDHLHNWWDFEHGLMIFLLLAHFWLSNWSNCEDLGIVWRRHGRDGLKGESWGHISGSLHWIMHSLSLVLRQSLGTEPSLMPCFRCNCSMYWLVPNNAWQIIDDVRVILSSEGYGCLRESIIDNPSIYNRNNATTFLDTWWRYQMGTFSALLAFCAGNSPVTDEFPAQRPVTRSFDVFFDLRLNKRLSKQLWRHGAHYDVIIMIQGSESQGLTLLTATHTYETLSSP